MKNQLILNPRRLMRLVGNNLNFSPKSIGLVLLFGIGINLGAAWMSSMDSTPDPEFYLIWFGLSLFITGFLFSSFAFNNMSTDAGRQFYLSLPASNLEKVLSKYLLTAIAFPLLALVMFTIIATLSNLFFFQPKMIQIDGFDPFGTITWLLIKIYLVLHGIYLLGSVVYSKLAIIKISLATFVFAGSIAGLTFLFIGSIFGFDFQDGPPFEPTQSFKDFLEFRVWPTIQFLFWAVLPVLSAVLVFLKLKEKEL
ncbi:MAG: hypothetical protein KDC34_00405 [Saprospiraceae bacterium]|nr:hypothetical protein [Saprospiraceae bacterium]